MMDTMIGENALTFKTLEKEIYRYVCRIGTEVTRKTLEALDSRLKAERDRSLYRDKGFRTTTVKTLCGEVTYRRTVYETYDEYGNRHFVYLLDENLRLDNVGLVSENCVELILSSITEMSYRNCAAKITEMTGQAISAMGVWNVIQSLGKKLGNDEETLVREHKAGHLNGTRVAPVLFEEADGIWLTLQGKDREKRGFAKAEMKLAIAYDGWKKCGNDRYALDGKVVTAGFMDSGKFHKVREAQIAKEYTLDETEVRIMNGDGAAWIKKVSDKSTVFQLDPFHKNKAVKENIPYAEAREEINKLLEEGAGAPLFGYLERYRDSLCDEEEAVKAEALIRYFRENEEGLRPYREQDIELPESPEGLEYRAMGTMENHVWSVIARRMKHNHTTWSISGGDHLAKILAKKCSGRLHEVTERLRIPVFREEDLEEARMRILSAAQVGMTVGKGYQYPVTGHLAYEGSPVRGDGKNRGFMMAWN